MKIKKSHITISLLVLILTLTVTGIINQSFNPQNELEIPKTSAGEITIVSPENKTYTEPMNGYYPGVIGFEDDQPGTTPNGWTDTSGSSCYFDIIAEIDGHNDVLRLVDSSSSYEVYAHSPVFDESDHGTIELWIKMIDANDAHYIFFNDASGNRLFYCDFVYNRFVHVYGVSNDIYEFGNIVDNEWYHLAVHFELRPSGNYMDLGQYQVKYELDGVESDAYDCDNLYDSIAQIEFKSYPNVESTIFYVDAIGLSWYDAYDVGDNKKEGLLLRYDTTFVPDWMGYSVNNQENRTIYGNTTIPLLENGDYNLKLYGNNSLGNMYFDEISFRVSRLNLLSPYNSIYMDPSGDLPITFETITDLVWMGYSLDGQSNVTILGNTTISMPADGYHTLQVFGKDMLNITYKSDVCSFQMLSSIDIDIVTPDEIIYTNPMSGYYVASRGFESDNIGAYPDNWLVNTPQTGSGFVEIDSLLAGHRNVLELRKTGGVAAQRANYKFDSGATIGTVEFWIYKDTDSSTDASFINIMGNGGSIRLIIVNRDLSRGGWSSRIGIVNDIINRNQWYHVRIDFDVNQGYQVQVGSTWYGSGYALPFEGTAESIDTFYIGSLYSGGNPNYGIWLDALGYSWDSNYNTGDNLEEGLLLRYDTNCELDRIGYSLDNNPYVNIPGNFTFAFPSNGSHTIRVKGNISTSVVDYSPTINFAINDWDDLSLNIVSPSQFEVYGYDSPDFEISGANINSSWYTLDNGLTNVSFTGFSGKIDQVEWDKLGDGTVTIHFYVNDSLGAIIFKEVNVTKDIITPIININNPTDNLLCGRDPPNYDISIIEANLDSYWYTLDGGVINITISSLTGILDQTEWNKHGNGTVTINFYALDEAGYEGSAQVTVRKEASPPQITILSPNENDLFSTIAPSFEIAIEEPDLNITWYTLNDGVTKIKFTGLIGTINQTEWNKFGNGTIVIKFYANDTLGFENFTQVIVRKDISAPIITINSPEQDEVFSPTAPIYNITVIDSQLDSIWYTIDNGLTILPVVSTIGTIDQTEWDKKDDGNIPIRFYANDTLGNTAFSQVVVIKSVFYGIDPVELLTPSSFSVISGNIINFSWSSLDAGFGAVNFTFQVSDSSDFGNINYQFDDIVETPVYTNFSVPLSLTQGEYFWRVRPTYGDSNGTWADYFTFTIIINNFVPNLVLNNSIPTSGNRFTIFRFIVIYTDLDNNEPEYVEILINGISYSMEKLSPSDTDYTDGCIYQYITLLTPSTTAYTISFECFDGAFQYATSTYQGPLVEPDSTPSTNQGDNNLNSANTFAIIMTLGITIGVLIPFIVFTEKKMRKMKLGVGEKTSTKIKKKEIKS